jgi:hypothetical protein
MASRGDLWSGLPFVGSVVLVNVPITVLADASLLAGKHAGWLVFPLGLASVLLSIMWLFATQRIVDARRNALAAIAESWHLVTGAGFWRVVGTLIVGGLCLAPVLIVFAVLLNIGSGWARVNWVSLVLTPLMGIFVTVMYFIANGERELIAAAAPPPSPRPAPDEPQPEVLPPRP